MIPKTKDPSYAEPLFVDSGAFSLFNNLVLKRSGGQKMGAHGKLLESVKPRSGQIDYSGYDLRKGSDFRAYCDDYAGMVKSMKDRPLIFASVDAIFNPDLTWEIQRFFEEEHGIRPIPVVHYGESLKYVDRYLEAGYAYLGIGGLGHQTPFFKYVAWADELYCHICPKPKFLPTVKTHGFAMTSFKLIVRYPWYSVDSATWVKLSAYGWLYIPRWGETKGWRYDRPPMQINFSWRSPMAKKDQKHYMNLSSSIRKVADKWLAEIGLKMGKVDSKGEMTEFGVSSHHRARNEANLIYLKCLEESRPPYPHRLDNSIVSTVTSSYRKGLGL